MANRHDLYIWPVHLHPLPDTFEQARDLAENLAEQTGTLTCDLLSLVEKTQAYIAKQSSQIKNAYRFFAKEITPKACLLLELPDYGWEQGLYFIVQTARELNLVVYDHELRMAFLPNEVLPAESEDYWLGLCEHLENPAFPTNDKDFADWFEPKLAQMLAKYSFTTRGITTEEYIKATDNLSNKYYVRQIQNGEQHIWVGYDAHRYKNEYIPYVYLGCLYPKVIQITNQFDFEKPYRGGGGYAYDDSFHVLTTTILNKSITNHELAFEYINILEKRMLTLADSTTTIQNLDKFFCQEKKNHPVSRMYRHSAYTPFRLAIAYLANNLNFESLAQDLANPESLVNLTNDRQERYHREYPKLVKYLQEEVKPLV